MTDDPVIGNLYLCRHPDHGAYPQTCYVQSNIGAAIFWCPDHGPLIVQSTKVGQGMSRREASSRMQMPARMQERANDNGWSMFVDVDDTEKVESLKRSLQEARDLAQQWKNKYHDAVHDNKVIKQAAQEDAQTATEDLRDALQAIAWNASPHAEDDSAAADVLREAKRIAEEALQAHPQEDDEDE